MTTPWLSWPRPPLSATRAEAVTAQAVRHRLSYASSRTRTIWEPRLARLAAAAVETELHLIAAGRIGAGVIWCSYEALPGFVERLQGLGVKFTQEPLEMGPVTTAVFDDTCGNLIQIAARH